MYWIEQALTTLIPLWVVANVMAYLVHTIQQEKKRYE